MHGRRKDIIRNQAPRDKLALREIVLQRSCLQVAQAFLPVPQVAACAVSQNKENPKTRSLILHV